MRIKNQLLTLLPQISESNILDEARTTEKYGLTTFSENVKLDAAVVVEKRSEIIDLVKVANHYNFVLYPLSTGKNWGYGCF